MEQGPLEETLIRRAHTERRPVPEKIANAPSLVMGLGFYFTSFIALSSCRPLGMSEGRIPWLAVHQYSEQLALTDEEFDDLWTLVSIMDGEYLKFRGKQMANKNAVNRPGGATPGK